jgi:hypothetical protein
MINKSSQMVSGKAFEYALFKEFQDKLDRITNVQVIVNDALNLANSCFKEFNKQDQGRYLLNASFAVNFLMDVEPRLSNHLDQNDYLQLEILTDYQGQLGDVRDIIAIRLAQQWEIGVSAKNNHKAVKHSRLSNDIDFGQKWLELSCSQNYFDEIEPIFSDLKEIQKSSKRTRTWKSLGDYHTSVYEPILNSFRRELLSLNEKYPNQVARNLVEYLVGKKDYYKVIKSNKTLEIQAYNIHGTLNLPFKSVKPKFSTPKVQLPSEITDISFKEGTNTTLIVDMNNDWKLSFRIHNASSRVEPSLKFDINLLQSPHSLFTNKLSIDSGESI